MTISTKLIAGTIFAVIATGGKSKTLPIEVARDIERYSAQQAAQRAACAELEAQSLSITIDDLIVAGASAVELRAQLEDIRQRYETAIADEREHRANLAELGSITLAADAADLVSTAAVAVAEVLAEHPVPDSTAIENANAEGAA